MKRILLLLGIGALGTILWLKWPEKSIPVEKKTQKEEQPEKKEEPEKKKQSPKATDRAPQQPIEKNYMETITSISKSIAYYQLS